MSHSEPKLLYAINGIQAYHIQSGSEESLTPSGPQTLSLLMVPTSSPFSDLSNADPQSSAPEEDFYLHLHLPPELDLPLPATTQIYHQPPNSYLIPRWDLGPDSGAFTRIEFPAPGTAKNLQEDIDTFETILAQCTAFLERAPAPSKSRSRTEKGKEAGGALPPYNPSEFKPGQAYVPGSSSSANGGQIVLIDEDNGSVVGELGEGFNIVEDNKMQSGSKHPVVISLPQDGSSNIGVAPASQEYLEMAMHPAYKNSRMVSKAAAASRLIVTTSSLVTNTLQSQADNFTKKTKPNTTPMTFAPTTHARVRKLNTFTGSAAGLSAKTVGQVSKFAQNLGASVKKNKAMDTKDPNYKPGLLNKSLMAFSTIADGIDQAGRELLSGTSTAATTIVGHKYGAEAGDLTRSVGGGVKNVGLVYIDAAGVSRRAIIKSVAKGMVVGKVKGGGDLVVGGGDGGVVTGLPANWKEKEASEGRLTQGDGTMHGAVEGPEVIGFGRQAPPAYGSGVGESIEGSRAATKEKSQYR